VGGCKRLWLASKGKDVWSRETGGGGQGIFTLCNGIRVVTGGGKARWGRAAELS